MKKIFVSFKFTGEEPVELMKNMSAVIGALREKGYKVYCNIESEERYQKEKLTAKQIFEDTLPNLDSSDAVFVFNNSDLRSEGMLIEIGYALAMKKPIIMAAKKGITANSSKAVSTSVIEFESVDDLVQQIKTLEI